MNDTFSEECGVFGIWGHADAVPYTAIGLTALQHRGQDSSGIAVSNAGQITRACRIGVVANLLTSDEYARLDARIAIGHVRYSTVGASGLVNAQPIVLDCGYGDIALCHNGQILNFAALKSELNRLGATWLTSSDSEVVLQLCKVSQQPTVAAAITEALGRLEGAYTLLLLAGEELIAARDRHGFRPLCLGRLDSAVIVSSETCALEALGAECIREIHPGEAVSIGPAGIRTLVAPSTAKRAHCVFEHVYFARPDSSVFNENVGAVRFRSGRNLAREAPASADLVVPVPDSGLWAAIGYHEESGIPLRLGLARNSYVGRTFIEPEASRRRSSGRLKLNAVTAVVAGKRVVLVDDSIVRGETVRRVVAALKDAGAVEVHVRIACPPTVAPCFYGVNTPDKDELIASAHTTEQVRRSIGADSLCHLTLDGLLNAVGSTMGQYCTACYTGQYTVAPPYPRERQRGVEDDGAAARVFEHAEMIAGRTP